MSDFKKELRDLLNKHSRDNKSNTQDNILANYLVMTLSAFDYTMKWRDDYQKKARCKVQFQFDETSKMTLEEMERRGIDKPPIMGKGNV